MDADFATVARLLASPARSTIVGALLEGRAMTAGELARIAGVAASTASEHLAELVSGGIVRVARQGRHRYFTLARPEVAEALEALSRICPAAPVRSLRASKEAEALGFARLCYDHLAGELGVALLDAFIANEWLDVAGPDGCEVTRAGEVGLTAFGVDVASLRSKRRHFAPTCLDWTARRSHLAGALGAGITGSLLERGWVELAVRRRGIELTDTGGTWLRRLIGLEVDGRPAGGTRVLSRANLERGDPRTRTG